jgi:hypothetical protein
MQGIGVGHALSRLAIFACARLIPPRSLLGTAGGRVSPLFMGGRNGFGVDDASVGITAAPVLLFPLANAFVAVVVSIVVLLVAIDKDVLKSAQSVLTPAINIRWLWMA